MTLAARREGMAATKQKEKDAKYNNEILPGRTNPTVIPLVLEHFRRWGEQVDKYLNKLAILSRNVKREEPSGIQVWMEKNISFTLQRCNAKSH